MNGLLRCSPFAPEYASRVLADVPMSRHTSWHVGGPADFFFSPRDAGDLAAFVRHLPADIALFWIGLGSNLLVRDGGIRGHVLEVEVLDRQGARRTRTPADYEIDYRRVSGPPDEWFLAAQLEFERKPGVNESAMRELLDKRRETQPIGEWSCGSVFTNPPGDHAARLIESAGLKGFRIGDASVSQKHANFIINHGAARAADIEALIEHVRRTVAEVYHIELATEVRIVGDPA